MNFYTYVGLIKNKIYCRWFQDDNEYSSNETFQPTMYVTAPPDKCQYKTLDGEPVGHV